MKLLGFGSRQAKVGLAVASALLVYLIITWALGKWLEVADRRAVTDVADAVASVEVAVLRKSVNTDAKGGAG